MAFLASCFSLVGEWTASSPTTAVSQSSLSIFRSRLSATARRQVLKRRAGSKRGKLQCIALHARPGRHERIRTPLRWISSTRCSRLLRDCGSGSWPTVGASLAPPALHQAHPNLVVSPASAGFSSPRSARVLDRISRTSVCCRAMCPAVDDRAGCARVSSSARPRDCVAECRHYHHDEFGARRRWPV